MEHHAGSGARTLLGSICSNATLEFFASLRSIEHTFPVSTAANHASQQYRARFHVGFMQDWDDKVDDIYDRNWRPEQVQRVIAITRSPRRQVRAVAAAR
jgi:hypothetical protein